MSTLEVKVRSVTLSEHPNAERLELARINGTSYISCVQKGRYKDGDLVAYIPEFSILPPELIEEMGLASFLAGPGRNRVHPVRLRGVFSQGVCYPAREGWKEGDDVQEILGITKYIPPVPSHLDGEVYACGKDKTIPYDIENWKNFPEVFREGEEVVFTEKIHGTFVMFGIMPECDYHPEHGGLVIASKSMASDGTGFKIHADANKNNVYCRVGREFHIEDRAAIVFEDVLERGFPVFILGEIFGQGVQDLHYGASTAQDDTLGFRVFDIWEGRFCPDPDMTEVSGAFLNEDALAHACEEMGLERVPVLYRGPFTRELMDEYTSGKETVSGEGTNIREGIVIRPIVERYDWTNGRGRAILKSISPDYLLRKGKKGEEPTEYQ